jgi:hypothetical protein
MTISGYFINDYWWILVIINGYYINGDWWILVVINGYRWCHAHTWPHT